jgi:hypothetical protein
MFLGSVIFYTIDRQWVAHINYGGDCGGDKQAKKVERMRWLGIKACKTAQVNEC